MLLSKSVKLTIVTLSVIMNLNAAELKKRWGYQLQNYKEEDFQRIESSKDALWVIDLAKGLDQNFNISDLNKFKKNNNSVIAYFSIGEAENYRYYWNKINIEQLKLADSEWANNVRVKYWMSEWQNMILEDSALLGKSYINRIIDAGFDGVYLDRVDIFEYFKSSKEKKQRAKQMAELVAKIAIKGRARNPNFMVFVQNGTSIINELKNPGEEYFKYIDGFGIEDLFHPGDLPNNNPFNPDKYVLEEISEIKNRFNKLFYSIDYIWGDEASYKRYMDASNKAGIIPLVAERELNGKLLLNN